MPTLDVPNDFRDAMLFLQDVGGELRGWQGRDVFLGARVLAVEIAAVGQQFGGGHFPGVVRFLALVPPRDERREFLELDGRGFGVVLPAFGQRLFVIPDFACRAGAVEEQQVRRDAGRARKATRRSKSAVV